MYSYALRRAYSQYTDKVSDLEMFSTMVPKTSAFEVGIYGREASVPNPHFVGHVMRSTPSDVFDDNGWTLIPLSMTSGLVSPANEASGCFVVLPWHHTPSAAARTAFVPSLDKRRTMDVLARSLWCYLIGLWTAKGPVELPFGWSLNDLRNCMVPSVRKMKCANILIGIRILYLTIWARWHNFAQAEPPRA